MPCLTLLSECRKWLIRENALCRFSLATSQSWALKVTKEFCLYHQESFIYVITWLHLLKEVLQSLLSLISLFISFMISCGFARACQVQNYCSSDRHPVVTYQNYRGILLILSVDHLSPSCSLQDIAGCHVKRSLRLLVSAHPVLDNQSGYPAMQKRNTTSNGVHMCRITKFVGDTTSTIQCYSCSKNIAHGWKLLHMASSVSEHHLFQFLEPTRLESQSLL